MNEVIEAILNRRSCKMYNGVAPEKEKLDAILEAGTFAATGKNVQSPVIVAVTDKATRDKLSAMNAKVLGREGVDPFYGAPVVAVVLADPAMFTFVEDGSLVMGNMMLAASALGVGSCWIHRAKEMFESEEGKALLKEWGLPETLRGIGNCVLGYPAEKAYAMPRAPRKKDYIKRV